MFISYPSENCHLNVKKLQKLDIFSKKLTKIVIFFRKIANGNFWKSVCLEVSSDRISSEEKSMNYCETRDNSLQNVKSKNNELILVHEKVRTHETTNWNALCTVIVYGVGVLWVKKNIDLNIAVLRRTQFNYFLPR